MQLHLLYHVRLITYHKSTPPLPLPACGEGWDVLGIISDLPDMILLHQGNFEEFVVRASALKNMRTLVLTTKQMIADPAKLT